MLYILDTELKENKSIHSAMQSIFGVGKSQSALICKKLGFRLSYKISEMSLDQTVDLMTFFKETDLILSSELKKSQILLLKVLIDIKTYKGLRRIRGLPIRGQRTHTNARNSRFSKRNQKSD